MLHLFLNIAGPIPHMAVQTNYHTAEFSICLHGLVYYRTDNVQCLIKWTFKKMCTPKYLQHNKEMWP